jgi:hypothetical protein
MPEPEPVKSGKTRSASSVPRHERMAKRRPAIQPSARSCSMATACSSSGATKARPTYAAVSFDVNREEIMHGLAADGMVVIQHQDEARRQTLDVVAQCDDEWHLRCRLGRFEQCESPGARFGEDHTDGGNVVMEEEQQVAIVFV